MMDTEPGFALMSSGQLQSSPTATTIVRQDKSAQRPTRHSEYCTDSPSSSGQQAQLPVEDELIAYQPINIPSLGVAGGDIDPLGLWSVPSFVTYDLSGISNEDIAYLQNKGCFDFPDKRMLDELLPYYFDYIHPHMPFIDETEFWYMYRTHYHNTEVSLDSSRPSFSLLLFQAILFATTTCAPMSLLRSLGYTSRSTARRNAFFRVRALYSLDIERDNLVLVQTFLLMSYWNEEVGEDKDGWHWAGLAVSLALQLGLHRQPSSKSTLTQRQQTIRRRCWWGCVVRDRLVALSQHRKPRIRLKDSDVEILTLADYNVGLRSGMSNLSSAEELGKRTAMSMFSLQLIRLVLCVERDDDLFHEQAYTPSPTSPPETWSRKEIVPFDDGLMIGHAGLDSWRLNLPEVLQLSTCPDADESILPCILVHRNVLQIYYHKLILSMVTGLLWPTRVSMGQASKDINLAYTSTLALVKLHNNLVDYDAIHCIPGSCFDAALFTRFDGELQTPPAVVCPLQTRSPSREATQIQSPISSAIFSANLDYQPEINRDHRTNMTTSCDYLNILDGDQPILDLKC
ncbi:Cutinase transcription factor 1 beta [Fusarium acutatum]|uniref:Cutinase transcription factor 1 beta n=1 Tax=Fusarium acutatum TaxID=78861 RepID=A0A8H4J9U3_9HYPO|nr:Cutinase transcription factor 1 beta [Fusarium acutatum]